MEICCGRVGQLRCVHDFAEETLDGEGGGEVRWGDARMWLLYEAVHTRRTLSLFC